MHGPVVPSWQDSHDVDCPLASGQAALVPISKTKMTLTTEAMACSKRVGKGHRAGLGFSKMVHVMCVQKATRGVSFERIVPVLLQRWVSGKVAHGCQSGHPATKK